MLSNHIAWILVEYPKAEDLQIFEPPVPLPDLEFRAMWSARRDSDPAIVWFRTIVIRSFEAINARVEKRLRDGSIVRRREPTRDDPGMPQVQDQQDLKK